MKTFYIVIGTIALSLMLVLVTNKAYAACSIDNVNYCLLPDWPYGGCRSPDGLSCYPNPAPPVQGNCLYSGKIPSLLSATIPVTNGTVTKNITFPVPTNIGTTSSPFTTRWSFGASHNTRCNMLWPYFDSPADRDLVKIRFEAGTNNNLARPAPKVIVGEVFEGLIDVRYLSPDFDIMYDAPAEGHVGDVRYIDYLLLTPPFSFSNLSNKIANEDKIINTIALNNSIAVRVIGQNLTSGLPDVSHTTTVPATNCVKISGGSGNKIVFQRENIATSSINDFLWQAVNIQDVIKQATTTTTLQFSIDLKKQTQSSFTPSQSSCGAGAYKYIFTTSPNSPVNLIGTSPVATQVNLSWQNDTYLQVNNFEIERSLVSNSGFIKIATSTTTSYIGNGFSSSISAPHYFRVRAAFSNGTFSNYSNTVFVTMTPPSLPQLGLYQDKLSALQTSVIAATDIMQAKRDAALTNQKGGPAMRGDIAIDGPLYLLKKMRGNLETEINSSLKDDTGFVRFFTYLKSLRNYTDPALSDVISRADDLAGFSYLFPPSPTKPTLISVTGAGGEGGWRGARTLLNAASTDFNIVVYTFDAATVLSNMRNAFLSKFIASGLNEQKNIILSLSMGSTFIHSAILQDAVNGGSNFSKSYVVITGFLPGGAAEFLRVPNSLIPSWAPSVYPFITGLFDVMNPSNPVYTNIANNINQIRNKTKGISYVQANNDKHIDYTLQVNPYASNRTTTLAGMYDTTYVTPPSNYINNAGQIEQNNEHINILYAPEVKNKIDYFRNMLLQSTTTTNVLPEVYHQFAVLDWVQRGMEFLGFTSKNYTNIALAQTPEIDFDLIDGFFGIPAQSSCSSAVDALRDSIEIPEMSYDTYASGITSYLSAANAPCTLDSVLQTTMGDIQPLPLSSNVPMSGTTALLFDLDVAGVSSVDLVVDGSVVYTTTARPWSLILNSNQLTNGSHTVKAVLHFPYPRPTINTKTIPIQVNNGVLPTPPTTVPSPTITITANPSVIMAGANTTLNWTTTDATSCTASGGWSGTKATSGTQVVGPLWNSTVFGISCTGPGGYLSLNIRVPLSNVISSPVTSPITATPTPQIMTINRSGHGLVMSGSKDVLCGEKCSFEYKQASTTRLIAIPESGSRFVGWNNEICRAGYTQIEMCEITAYTGNPISAVFENGDSQMYLDALRPRTVTNGSHILLKGKNISRTGNTVFLFKLDGQTRKVLDTKISSSEFLQVAIPRGTPAGEYKIVVISTRGETSNFETIFIINRLSFFDSWIRNTSSIFNAFKFPTN